jgi:hypothetical protein
MRAESGDVQQVTLPEGTVRQQWRGYVQPYISDFLKDKAVLLIFKYYILESLATFC